MNTQYFFLKRNSNLMFFAETNFSQNLMQNSRGGDDKSQSQLPFQLRNSNPHG